MFNASRQAGTGTGGGLLGTSPNGYGASFLNDNPLTGSMYDPDPWSAAPTPPPSSPRAANGPFSFLTTDTRVPATYAKAFALVDTGSTGETSLSSLHRVVSTSGLPPSTIDRIVNLVSTHTRVTRLEFYVALCLVAIAQAGQDISIERVAALAQENAMPDPSLDLSGIAASAFNNFGADTNTSTYTAPDDPWTMPINNALPDIISGLPTPASATIGTGLPMDWYRRQESVSITLHGQEGFFLSRHTVYEITTDRGAPVHRRYSEFVFLYDVFVRRYPFRLIAGLPPKRIGADEAFIEQRRRGLTRFLNSIINHPTLRSDGVLSAFLTEPSFEDWRRHSPAINYDEESSTSRKIDAVEEMTIPEDLDDKLLTVRRKLGAVIEHWQRICLLGDRLAKRREASAADLTRLSMTLDSLGEVRGPCWRGEGCESCIGVRDGLTRVSRRLSAHAANVERRANGLFSTTLESLKLQRDLFLAMRDLFTRHDRYSGDAVDRLRKRVETMTLRLAGVRSAQKDGWQGEAERLGQSIETDQAAINVQLARRVFVRHSMWHELRVVLHNRENTLLVVAVQELGRDEREFAEVALATWNAFAEEVEGMPLE
ncbi:hypothetical protein BKA62DRAFT_826193 [Auriculariales sp. MPI-PUGE-AT-0066]|nr:hypothetical protein BKA62DRAFT_826193 [Auriculariales sp. MPI-PUGE-AT-0066]